MSQLYDEVLRLHQANAIHIRKGFHLLDASIADCTNHLLEETVEAQAEVLSVLCLAGLSHVEYWGDNRASVIEELGDARSVYLHLLIRMGLTEEDVDKIALEKLARSFTSDPDKVTATIPGVTRKGRK